jgi:hypothetical protein
MIVTESEAKEKWCPFSRVAFPAGESANRVSDVRLSMSGPDGEYFQRWQKDTHCIGSRCMAWRAQQRTIEDDFTVSPPHRSVTDTGYCGLSGEPKWPRIVQTEKRSEPEASRHAPYRGINHEIE